MAALHRAGDSSRDQIQALIEASEEHSAMVRQLEAQHDSERGLSAIEFSNLPTGDEIAGVGA